MATMSELTVGAGFRTRVWRDGAGEPLLYLHGFEGHPGEAPFLQRLAERHAVYAPELPGFGESSGIEQIDDVLDLALYLRSVFKALGLARADVIGHSLGGMFAAELAAICPQIVRRLVLVAPFGLWLDESPIPDPFVMSPGQLQRSLWHNPEALEVKEAVAALANGRSGIAATVERAGNLSSAGKFLWPIPDRGLRKRLRFVEAPTLIVLGDSDKLITRPYGDAFAGLIAGARLQTIADAGHAPMIEQPAVFDEVVEQFLAS